MKKEQGIDDIFKHGLQSPGNEPEFAGHDWDALEHMLDKKAGRRNMVWLRYVSAAAAVALLVLCWWLFKPADTQQQNTAQAVKQQQGAPMLNADTANRSRGQIVNAPSQKSNAEEAVIPTTVNPPTQTGNVATVKRDVLRERDTKDTGIKGHYNLGNNDNLIVAAAPTIDVLPSASANAFMPVNDALVTTKPRPLNVSAVDVPKVASSAFKPQFALSVLAAPELNGIGSLRSAGKGTNVGMMLTVGVKKLSLSTGVNYTVKPYTLPYSQYPATYNYNYTINAQTVTADCRMIDIPINIGYQVYNKSGHKITMGTGVSSYIMMHESYTYDYADPAKAYGPANYTVNGKGKYPFSIMNVQATYERQLNSKFGLSVQPYYKIPLSDIGYSQVRVQTLGVAVGLNWNINQLTKPK